MTTYILQPIGAGPAVEALDASDTIGEAIRSVGSSTPITTSWSAGQIWIDTLNGATANVIRVWSGSAFVPARSTALPLLVDPFTGSNGAALSNWVTGVDPSTGTGGGATIQSNQARFQTSTTGEFGSGGRIARRANITNPTDANMAFSFKFDSTSPGVRAWMRAENTMAGDHGYFMEIEKGVWRVSKAVSTVESALGADLTFGGVEGTLYSARLRVVGTTVQAKLWTAADAEPTSWDFTTTDSAVSAAGAVGFDVINGGASGASANFFVDDVTIEAT